MRESSAWAPVSLEKPMGDEEDSSLSDFIADESAESLFEIASASLRKEDL